MSVDVEEFRSLGECVYDLGQGLELWRVKVSTLREQDVNARSMTKTAFDRLTATISRDKRLESLPLCALTVRNGQGRIEIVSGHHRVRAARAAGVEELHVLVEVTGLTDDEIKAKQLAHNSIAGEDDPQLVKRIFESIQRADARIEAFIDPKEVDAQIERMPVGTVELGMQFKTALTVFIPYHLEEFERVQEHVFNVLSKSNDVTYIADIEMLEHWKQALGETAEAYDIKAIGSVIGKMSEIVLKELGEETSEPERVHVRDLFQESLLPPDVARVIEKAFEKAEKEGVFSGRQRWKALEAWATAFLEDEE